MMPDLSPARCDHLKTVSVRTRNTSALLVSFTPPSQDSPVDEEQEKRKQELKEQTSTAGMGDPGLADTEKMPDGMWVHELTEILGERCCQVGKLSKKRRRSGPCGTSYSNRLHSQPKNPTTYLFPLYRP